MTITSTQALTTLARFKTWKNIQTSTDDDFVQDLINGASIDILSYLERRSLFKNTYVEYYDGTGGARLMLRQNPVLSVTSVLVNSVALTAAVYPNSGYFVDPWDGWVPAPQQFLSLIGTGNGAIANNLYAPPCNIFPRAPRNVQVTYVAGYAVQNEQATIPGSPYQITAVQALGTWGQDDGVTNVSTGAAFTKVTGTPSAGQYSVSNGVYTFAAADTATAVYINYSYVPYAIEKAAYILVGENYQYRQHQSEKTRTLAGNIATSYDNSNFTQAIIKLLQPYKRMVPF